MLAALIYPSWWFVFRITSSEFRGSLAGFLAVAGLFACFVPLSLRSRRVASRIQITHTLLMWTLTAHYFYIVSLNKLAVNQAIGMFIAVGAISSTFLTKLEGLGYFVLVMLLAVFLPSGTGGPDKLVLNFGLVTVMLVSFIANLDRMRMIQSLQANEKNLQESDAKKLEILNSIFDGFAYLDRDYRVIYANPIGERLVGLSGTNYVGKVLWDLFPEAFHGKFRSAYEKAMNGEASETLEYLASVGTWFEVRAIPNGNGISISYRDVTERIRMEKEVEEQKMKAVVSSKLSTLGEMAGTIAHEINNPLAIISGRAQILREKLAGPKLSREEILKSVESIDATALRIAKIVRALRNLSRDGERDSLVTTPVADVVSQTLEICRERFKNNGVQLRTEDCPFDLTVDCRPVQISQVLLNLLANAFDEVSGTPSAWVQLEVLDLGDEVQLVVSDSGPGIPADIQAKMFEPFYTTKEVGKGTGLGLSISKSIIESHGGYLAYAGNRGHTCFVISLPKRQETEVSPSAA